MFLGEEWCFSSRPVVATLAKTTLSGLDTRERLFASGVEIRPAGADEFASLIKSEVDKWSKVIKAAGLKAD